MFIMYIYDIVHYYAKINRLMGAKRVCIHTGQYR